MIAGLERRSGAGGRSVYHEQHQCDRVDHRPQQRNPYTLCSAIADAARGLALRHGNALAAFCCADAGDEGAALLRAALDMLADGEFHPAAAPLRAVTAMLALSARRPRTKAMRELALLVRRVEALSDVEIIAVFTDRIDDQSRAQDDAKARAA